MTVTGREKKKGGKGSRGRETVCEGGSAEAAGR